MADMLQELKPCPFCGSSGTVSDYQDLHSPGDQWQWIVMCSSEGCPVDSLLVQRDTREEAIDAWNRRDPAIEQEVRDAERQRMEFIHTVALLVHAAGDEIRIHKNTEVILPKLTLITQHDPADDVRVFRVELDEPAMRAKESGNG